MADSPSRGHAQAALIFEVDLVAEFGIGRQGHHDYLLACPGTDDRRNA
jgi:hypothetical protein